MMKPCTGPGWRDENNTGYTVHAIFLHHFYTILLVLSRVGFGYHPIMMSNLTRTPNPFDRPGIYQIRVQGRIDPNWSDRVGGMTICQAIESGGHIVTTLEGELIDQTALAGVLNTLYELHLLILSVKRESG